MIDKRRGSSRWIEENMMLVDFGSVGVGKS